MNGTRTVIVRDTPITLVNSSHHTNWVMDQMEARAWEEDTFDAIDEYVGEGSIVWDIGAWIGIFSLYAAAKGAYVYAIEPDPVSYDMLRTNLIDTSVLPMRAALMDRDGQVELGIQEELGDSMTGISRPGSRFPVKAVSVSTLLEVWPPPTFIKCDVEGAERYVAGPLMDLGVPMHLSWHVAEAGGPPMLPADSRVLVNHPAYPTFLVNG